MSTSRLLDHALIYTAMTRGIEQVVSATVMLSHKRWQVHRQHSAARSP